MDRKNTIAPEAFSKTGKRLASAEMGASMEIVACAEGLSWAEDDPGESGAA
jgi:hypothetical protein